MFFDHDGNFLGSDGINDERLIHGEILNVSEITCVNNNVLGYFTHFNTGKLSAESL